MGYINLPATHVKVLHYNKLVFQRELTLINQINEKNLRSVIILILKILATNMSQKYVMHVIIYQ